VATGTIARRTGTMLVPGVSLNRRLYTKELITKAVNRMQERIGSPDGLPIVMRTHHEAGDNSTLIVGKITGVTVDDNGVARYESAIYDTPEGRTIATLTDPKDPALKSTSIHGYWLGPVKRVNYENQPVETGDDLEIDAVDFTATPGVLAAVVDGGTAETTESGLVRTPICESYAVDTTTTGEAQDPQKPYGDVTYADPGYQKDGKKRYPLDTKSHIQSAWSYINQRENAAKYTSDQLSKIKGRIKSAAKKVGIDISSDESCLIDRWTEQPDAALAEFYGDDPIPAARFSVSVSNGPVDVVISSYCVDPADLDVVARAAMDGACQALAGLDPDDDGDIDVPGMVTASVTTLGSDTAPTTHETAPEVGDTATTDEGTPTVSGAPTNEATTTAAPTAPAPTQETEQPKTTLTTDDIKAIGETVGASVGSAMKELAAALAPAVTPQQAPAAEPAPTPTTESTTKVDEGTAVKEAVTAALTEMRGQLTATFTAEVDKLRAETRETLAAAGIGVRRIGYRVAQENNNGGDREPTPEELFDNRASVLLGDFARTPVPHAGTGVAVAPAAAQR
jgi:hypothetical protein